ncbi:MAG: sigma factor [Tissierellia bacterium]|nr:sigma factor [Tissierellia bacterium]
MTKSNEELIKLAKAGDTYAYNELYENNKAAIYKLISSYKYKYIDDAEGEANIAFVEAFNNYDETKGKFITFLWNSIIYKLKNKIREENRIKRKTKLFSINELENILNVKSNYNYCLHDLLEILNSKVKNEIQRDIIKYCIIKGEKYSYVGKIHNVKQQNLTWHINKVKDLLKEEFANIA